MSMLRPDDDGIVEFVERLEAGERIPLPSRPVRTEWFVRGFGGKVDKICIRRYNTDTGRRGIRQLPLA